jgi:hypothetical protein
MTHLTMLHQLLKLQALIALVLTNEESGVLWNDCRDASILYHITGISRCMQQSLKRYAVCCVEAQGQCFEHFL